MKILNGQLQLKYAFISSPNPIRASGTGANPNTVDLTVIISNQRTRPVEIAGIKIEIPMGENSQRTLSSQPNLPAPVFEPTSDWSITTSGGKLLIQAADEDAGDLASVLIVKLEGITINEVAGIVPITITEIYPSGASMADNMSYWLTKQEADCPVTNFWAEPDTLYDLSHPVKLFWTVSDQGKTLAYGLQSNDWQPRDCLNQGNCFSWQEGRDGVSTPPLNATTSFNLIVYGTDSSGGRRELKKLPLTVRVVVPSVLENSYIERIGMDRFVSMHWIAYNAVRCEVLLDGRVIDERAPVDTYVQGYPLILPEAPGKYQLSVIAYSESGVQAPRTFPDVAVGASTALAVGGNARALAITPDSKLALVASTAAGGGAVTVIDIATWKAESATMPVTSTPQGIAITPDGKTALVSSLSFFGAQKADSGDRIADPALHIASAYALHDDQPAWGIEPAALPDETPLGAAALPGELEAVSLGVAARVTDVVTFIDVAKRKAESSTVPVPGAFGVSITPDGRYALVSEFVLYDTAMIDVAKRSLAVSIRTSTFGGVSNAITPDGKLALVLGNNKVGMAIIDIATRTVEPVRLLKDGVQPTSIAITPDGKLALVAGSGSDSLTVIDIPGRRVEPKTIPIPRLEQMATQAIAITRDGRYAMVVSSGGVLTIIDIAKRAAMPGGTIPIPRSRCIRISPDGKKTIIIELDSNRVIRL